MRPSVRQNLVIYPLYVTPVLIYTKIHQLNTYKSPKMGGSTQPSNSFVAEVLYIG